MARATAAPSWQRWTRSPAALVLGVLAAALALAPPFYRHRNLTTDSPPEKSIAVLPFLDLSETKDQEYFCDGMSEEILEALAKVDGLRVVGRTSSFSFKGKNVNAKEVGEKLNVANVLAPMFGVRHRPDVRRRDDRRHHHRLRHRLRRLRRRHRRRRRAHGPPPDGRGRRPEPADPVRADRQPRRARDGQDRREPARPLPAITKERVDAYAVRSPGEDRGGVRRRQDPARPGPGRHPLRRGRAGAWRRTTSRCARAPRWSRSPA